MMKNKILFLICLGMAFLSGTANAVLIDFEDQSSRVNIVGALVYPEATFTSSTGNIHIIGRDAGYLFNN